MVDIVILCPIEVEFEVALRKLLFANQKETIIGGIPCITGTIKGENQNWKIALVEPTTKEANFQIEAYETVRVLSPKYVFLLGVAGGVKDAITGDLAIGTKAYGYESGKETTEGFRSRPNVRFNTSDKLIQIAQRVGRNIKRTSTYKIYFGPIASGGKVIANTQSQTFQNIKTYYEDTLAIEKESYAFASIAQKLKIPYLNIRGISDLLDDKKQSDDSGGQVLAAERAADFLQQLILRLPPLPTSRPLEKETNINVLYLKETANLLDIRRFKKAALVLQKKRFTLKNKQGVNISGEIQSLEKVKMSGDFGKAWIKIYYKNLKNQPSSFYITKQSLLPGLNFIFGGGKTLLRQLNGSSY